MRRVNLFCDIAVGAVATVVACSFTAACNINSHPDDKQAVYNALHENDLRSVEVFQDRHKGEITLRGIVASSDQKAHAVTLAQQAAPGYAIKDQVQVQSAGLEGMVKSAEKKEQLDSAIEDNFKASIQSDKTLGKEDIQYDAEKGTLYLKGSVKTEREKQDAEDLAKKIPQVQHVVNNIAVKPS
jgi:hyperosmotically inducible protein